MSLSSTTENAITNSFELLDFQSLSDATLTLLPQYYQQAIELSREITHPQQQWQTYLNVLALSGFEQWLARREPEFINHSRRLYPLAA